MTVDDIFREARQQCRFLYSEQEINAMVRVLLQHYTGLTIARIYAEPHQLLPTAYCLLLTDAINQLSTGRPLQYVIGKAEFCGITFEVNEQVLIPRPETEELVRWAVEELQAYTAPVVLDLCTGSGCIAIAIAKQCPTAKVLACDISTEALAVAQRNAAKNKVAINFFHADILNNSKFKIQNLKLETRNSKFIILSNPPYICNSEKAMMHQNVLGHEPHEALFVSDVDPLMFYRAIAAIARQCIVSDGFVMVEINETLAADTMQVLRDAGFSSIMLRQDINGKDRMILCR
ncbi:MAG: peptide chain release factor N(5)-glutamine methyltransferase [Prevotellaceae bacterium]|jgi:release factor glutamine methyltransferase|nr:peptide chain release factor N(5)-glutamine methyltransferase [Prevotellaceae bacterium]